MHEETTRRCARCLAPRQERSLRQWLRNATLSVSLLMLGAPAALGAPDARSFSIESLSTRPENVTGGNVLVRIGVPRTVPMQQVRVSLNGRDISRRFSADGTQGRTLLGLVDGLDVGENTLEVRANGEGRGRPIAVQRFVNHPIAGPVFSGPHQTPFICQTQESGLSAPLDSDCTAPVKVEYQYRSTQTNDFKPLDLSAPKPADLATTTITTGETVDYVVRLETGTINRAVYQIALLHVPGRPLTNPWTRTSGWNNRLVYSFGGGCAAGYRQGSPTPAADPSGGVMIHEVLSLGFGVASSTLNMFRNDCNDIRSAETLMMVKEHFVESFGVPDFTIGWGCSGGSMQAHLIAQNYPGMLDGIVPGCSFSDVATSVLPVIADCEVITRAFAQGTQAWSLIERSAVTGFGNNGARETCATWSTVPWNRPRPCPSILPASVVYDPVTNPTGVRCSIYDNTVTGFGVDPKTGFAQRPLDNVGIQYGLRAFNAGIISFEQFAELNALAGGHDPDGNVVQARTTATETALRQAYRTGRVFTGAGLAEVPIIDLRGYMDDRADIHDRSKSFVTRARLAAANGQTDNHVIWIAPGGGPRHPASSFYVPEALKVMNDWLDAIMRDDGPDSRQAKVLRNKPAAATDTCWAPDGTRIVEAATVDGAGACSELYPTHSDPRLAAGAPLSDAVLKCQRKPVSAGDYAIKLTDAQLQRLRSIFPDGVCDWTQPGVQQQPPAATWLRY